MPYDAKSNATCRDFGLSVKKVLKKTLPATLIMLIIALVVLVIYLSLPQLIEVGDTIVLQGLFLSEVVVIIVVLGIIALITIVNLIYQYLYYKTYYYDLREDLLIIRKGVFIPNEISVPFGRIQDVYVDRDRWDLLLGLYDVHVSSATLQSGIEAHIDGVNKDNATIIKEMIFEKMKAAKTGSGGL